MARSPAQAEGQLWSRADASLDEATRRRPAPCSRHSFFFASPFAINRLLVRQRIAQSGWLTYRSRNGDSVYNPSVSAGRRSGHRRGRTRKNNPALASGPAGFSRRSCMSHHFDTKLAREDPAAASGCDARHNSLGPRFRIFHVARANGTHLRCVGGAVSLPFIARTGFDQLAIRRKIGGTTMKFCSFSWLTMSLMSRFCSVSGSGATSVLAALQWSLPNLPKWRSSASLMRRGYHSS